MATPKNAVLVAMHPEKKERLRAFALGFSIDGAAITVTGGEEARKEYEDFMRESDAVRLAMASKKHTTDIVRAELCEHRAGDEVVFKCARPEDAFRQTRQIVTRVIPITYGKTMWGCFLRDEFSTRSESGPFPSEVLEVYDPKKMNT
jgi:hypothetical protein